MNLVVVNGADPNELKHYGKLGMKWGMRSHAKRTNSLNNKVNTATRKADSLLNNVAFINKRNQKKLRKVSKQVRQEKVTVERRIRGAQRFLDKANKADAAKVINRYNKDPIKRELTKKYIESLKMNSMTLSELRMQTIDLRID